MSNDNQKKLKVYLDTSVISYLHQEDTPERMRDTQALWQMFREEKFEVCLSPKTLEELGVCYEPKRTMMFERLDEIKYSCLPSFGETVKLANKIVEMGILTAKSIDDCYHIATAVLAGCDCIISWNFRHMVNVKTIRGIRAITNLDGYKPIEIVSPTVLIEHQEDEEYRLWKK